MYVNQAWTSPSLEQSRVNTHGLSTECGLVNDAVYIPSHKRIAVVTAGGRLCLHDALSLKPLHQWRLGFVAQAVASMHAHGATRREAHLLLGDQSGRLHVLDVDRRGLHTGCLCVLTWLAK